MDIRIRPLRVIEAEIRDLIGAQDLIRARKGG